MIISYSFNSLIISCFISVVHSQNMNPTLSAASSAKIGPCSCALYGNHDPFCEFETILCDQLPDECSSYFWMEASVDLSYNVKDFVTPGNDVYIKKIMQCTKKPVIVTYGYKSLKDWSTVLACCGADGMNVQDEMEGLKVYRKDHPNIAGLALSNLDIVPDLPSFKDFTKNLKCYIIALKKCMPDLDIGIYIDAEALQWYFEDPKVEWINFKELANVVDFVVLSYSFFRNLCTPDLKNGVFPITGNYDKTLEKSLKDLSKAGVPANITYFRFEFGPVSKDVVSLCDVNIKLMCLNPKNATDYCSDTTATYYEKGVFAKNNGVGFVASYVDKDDVHRDCQCDRSYPSFRAILDGFEGASRPPPCRLLDRN